MAEALYGRGGFYLGWFGLVDEVTFSPPRR